MIAEGDLVIAHMPDRGTFERPSFGDRRCDGEFGGRHGVGETEAAGGRIGLGERALSSSKLSGWGSTPVRPA